MLEVTTSWTIPSGIPTKSVMYFADGTTAAVARERVWGALNGVTAALTNGVEFSVDAECRVLNPATGELTGIETDATSRTGDGSGAGNPVPDAAQVLIACQTGVVVAGRFVQGRTFIPGLDAALTTGGNVAPAAVGDFNGFANDMVSPSAGFGIWHRPKGGAGGSFHLATGGVCRSEMAVLRRRRNR